jgi:hypothetical protein
MPSLLFLALVVRNVNVKFVFSFRHHIFDAVNGVTQRLA